jgi:uncharacterized membrane protein YgdD (TMEM256/DUF423 family)
MKKTFLVAGALFGGVGVALGAFGAHGLRDILSEEHLKTFHTAVEYQFYHAFALLLTGLISERIQTRPISVAGNLFIAGIILFSGSLYLLAIFEPMEWIGIVTPFGGLCFLGGWGFLLTAVLRK